MIYNIILVIIVTIETWAIINLTKKVEKYEDIIDENDKFIVDELGRNEALLEALRQIDNRQMFEKDDDVGSIFNLIKETIERYKKR